MKQWVKKIIFCVGAIMILIVIGVVWYNDSIDTNGTYIDYIVSYYDESEDDICYHEYLITEKSYIMRTFYKERAGEFNYEGIHPMSKYQYIKFLRQAILKEKFFSMETEKGGCIDADVELEICYGGQKKRRPVIGSDLDEMVGAFIYGWE